MALPFDLEDIVGVAVADVLRRAGLIIGCVLGAGIVAGLGLAVGEVAASVAEYGSIGGAVGRSASSRFLWIALAPVASGWGVLYVPFLIGMGIFFVRAEAPGARGVAISIGCLALILILSADDPDWFGPSMWGISLGGGVGDPARSRLIMQTVAIVSWLGFAGAVGFLAVVLERRARVKAEEHLMGVTIENEQRRQQLRGEHGIVIADRGYAVEEELPP